MPSTWRSFQTGLRLRRRLGTGSAQARASSRAVATTSETRISRCVDSVSGCRMQARRVSRPSRTVPVTKARPRAWIASGSVRLTSSRRVGGQPAGGAREAPAEGRGGGGGAAGGGGRGRGGPLRLGLTPGGGRALAREPVRARDLGGQAAAPARG